MRSATTEAGRRERVRQSFSLAHLFRVQSWRASIPFVYLGVALPISLVLCFLIPPMQSPDEGRHFLRACQFAEGQLLPQVDSATHEAGGLLPKAAVAFVSDKMDPEYYRKEDHLPTLGARLRALDSAAQHQAPLTEREFGVFPGSAIYPPALYLPQTAGIWLARSFSGKVYVWFYASRVCNAVTAVLLIFIALLLSPGYRFALMIPAVLPMSLYQISSVSSDAGFISISILFVALCIRFIEADGRHLRGGLIVCLLLLTLAKPVYLPFALLLLPAHKRLGWKRTILFCASAIVIAAGAYLAWSYFVRPIFAIAGNDFQGHNPSAQVHSLIADPLGFVLILLRTVRLEGREIMDDLIGTFGWSGLPLPHWFYCMAYAFLAAIFLLAVLSWKKVDAIRLVFGGAVVASILLAISLAGFILWTPVGSSDIPWLQGRYFIPVLAVLPFFIAPLNRRGTASRLTTACLTLGFFAVSALTTVRIADHYFFPSSMLLGKNIQDQFALLSGQSCPASADAEFTTGWFSTIARGRADVRGNFRVAITNETGTILGESDPVLAGADFPFDLLPGSSHSRWLVHLWMPNRYGILHYWLVRGKTACTFGPALQIQPYEIPSA